MSGHCDWIKSVAVNCSDSVLASGDAVSILGLWDISSMRNERMLLLPGAQECAVNLVMDLHFSKTDPCLCFAYQKSGHICLCDIRSPEATEWRAQCHIKGRAGHMMLSEDSMKIASSARGSEIKLWDVRRMAGVNDFLQIFNQHKSQQLPLGLDFLDYENYIVSGSDNGHAYIYETNSGKLAHKVKLGFGQVQTGCATDKGSLSFFTTYMNARYLGLVDTEGEDISHEAGSVEQIKDLYEKEAWDTAVGKFTERVVTTARSVQTDIQVGFEHWINIIRSSDLSVCKELMRDIEYQYEEERKSLAPQLARDLHDFALKNSPNLIETDEFMQSGSSQKENKHEFSIVKKEVEVVKTFP